MKKLLSLGIWGLSLLVTSVNTFAKVLPKKMLSEAAVPADTVYLKGSWTIGLEASNNSSFFGRISEKKYPYTAATLTYIHYTGLYASATGYQLFNTPGYLHETDLALGYGFNIGKKITANLSYSRFFFSQDAPLVKAVTSDALNASGSLDWKILYSTLTTSYLFGESNDVFVVLDNSRYIALNPIWKGKTTIGLDPKISITAGTQQFVEEHFTMVTKQQQKKEEEEKKKGVGGILNPLLPGNGNNGNSGNNPSGTTTKTETTTTTDTTTTVSTRFNVINYDLKIPVVIMLGNFEIEPSWRFSIPVNLNKGDASKPQSFYTISVNYSF